jgi:hypothetical protein
VLRDPSYHNEIIEGADGPVASYPLKQELQSVAPRLTSSRGAVMSDRELLVAGDGSGRRVRVNEAEESGRTPRAVSAYGRRVTNPADRVAGDHVLVSKVRYARPSGSWRWSIGKPPAGPRYRAGPGLNKASVYRATANRGQQDDSPVEHSRSVLGVSRASVYRVLAADGHHPAQ